MNEQHYLEILDHWVALYGEADELTADEDIVLRAGWVFARMHRELLHLREAHSNDLATILKLETDLAQERETAKGTVSRATFEALRDDYHKLRRETVATSEVLDALELISIVAANLSGKNEGVTHAMRDGQALLLQNVIKAQMHGFAEDDLPF